MFIKEYDSKYKDYFKKGYLTNNNIVDVINTVTFSGIPYESVTVVEDVDMDMKYYSGNYEFQSFLDKYDTLPSAGDEFIYFLPEEEGSICIETKDKRILLSHKDESVEIEDLIDVEEKNHRM